MVKIIAFICFVVALVLGKDTLAIVSLLAVYHLQTQEHIAAIRDQLSGIDHRYWFKKAGE